MNDLAPENLYKGIEFIAEAFHDIRRQVINGLTDADLNFKLPNNPILGEVLADLAGIEGAYADSFTSLKLDWKTYQRPQPLSTTADYLAAFDGTFGKLRTALSGYSFEQGKTVTVNRGGWEPNLMQQFDTYAQAVLIVFGKLDVYVKALGKPVPERWGEWVG